MARIKVIHKQTGQTGTIEEKDFDPKLFQRVDQGGGDSSMENVPEERQGVLKQILTGAAKPFGKAAGLTAEALFQTGRLATDPEFRKLVTQGAGSLSKEEQDRLFEKPQTVRQVAEGRRIELPDITALTDEELEDRKSIGKETAKTAAGVVSYRIPLGGSTTKMAAQGALAGGLQGFSQTDEETLPDIGKDVLSGAGGGAAGGIALGKALPALAGAIKNTIAGQTVGKAAQGLHKASPSKFTNAVAEKGFDINQLVGKYTPADTTYDDLLGPISAKGKGGVLKQQLDEAEEIIQATADTAGDNIRLSGDDVVASLKGAIDDFGLGEGRKKAAMEEIVEEAQKKYKGGVTVREALKTLRNANKKFGKAIVETSGDAVARSAQKLEGNVLRAKLKNMFPEMADALDTQAELLTIRPILNKARGTASTQGSTMRTGGGGQGVTQLLNPVFWRDIVTNNPRLASTLLGVGKGVKGVVSKTDEMLPDIPVKKGTELLGRRVGTRVSTSVGDEATSDEQDARQNDNDGTAINAKLNQQDENIDDDSHTSNIQQQSASGQITDETGAWIWNPEKGDWEKNPEYRPQDNQFSAERMRRALLWDFQNTGGKNEEKIRKYFELANPKLAEEGDVTATEKKRRNLAKSGLKSLETVRDIFTNNQGIATKRAVTAGLGTRKFDAAMFNAVDTLLRLRTGAQAPPGEVRSYMNNYGPRVGDDPETVRFKLDQLENALGLELQGPGVVPDQNNSNNSTNNTNY